MTALLPALLLAQFALWSGTFHGGAGWSGALAGDVAMVSFALAASPRLRDPLRLGSAGQVLVWALVAAAAASAAASPVPRAGLESLAILPALLLVPAAVERLWRDADRRRRGCRALTVLVLVIAGWSLVDAASSDVGRAAAPIGHHGALATWLLFLLPFSALVARDRGIWRAVGVTATTLSVGSILATRSLVGMALLVLQAGMLLRAHRASRWVVIALAVMVAAANAPRLIAVATGTDPSVGARGAYFAAGVAGIRERPALGFGPGSVGWTLGDHLHPVPGRNPPGEVVSYLHFLPLDLAYQIGVAGALLAVAVAVAFSTARRRELIGADDVPLFDAAMAALLAGSTALAFAGFQPLLAVVVAAAVAAGAALAATTTRRPAPSARARGLARVVVLLYVAGALGVLAPVRHAQRLYDEARSAGDPFELLDRAAAADATFPLYAARRAWAAASAPSAVPPAARSSLDSRTAGDALGAAERAPGVAALWLAAGLLGADSGAPWSPAALRRACDLDPLGALAPFRLMTLGRDDEAAAIAGARALLAEPRLAAALEWKDREALYRRALDQIGAWAGVAPSWRRRAVAQLAALPSQWGARTRPLFLELDGQAQTSVSLFVFRRLPWRTTLGAIDLDDERLRRIAVDSAALRADSEPWAFATNECGGPEPPGESAGAAAVR